MARWGADAALAFAPMTLHICLLEQLAQERPRSQIPRTLNFGRGAHLFVAPPPYGLPSMPCVTRMR